MSQPLNIKINSILGGHSSAQYFNSENSFNSSVAIDPDYPIVSTDVRTSGFVVPTAHAKFSGAPVNSYPIAIINNPKDTLTYVVLSNGRLISYNSTFGAETNIGTVTGGLATGAFYYNNYIYIMTGTDVSRYGPLTNTPTLTNTIWTAGVLALTALTNTAYPSLRGLAIPNHWGHIHGDGSAYFCDFINGQGMLHRINMKKVPSGTCTVTIASPGVFTFTAHGLVLGNIVRFTTTGALPTGLSINTDYFVITAGLTANAFQVSTTSGGSAVNTSGSQSGVHTCVPAEGDANGTTVASAYNVLALPFGYYPVDVSSYGTDIAIVALQIADTTIEQGEAAMFLWDPTNTVSFYRGPIPLSDPLVTAIENVNGILHIWSGNANNGVRMSKYIGGDSIAEIAYQEEGTPPMPGAVAKRGNRIVWGGWTTYPINSASVFAINSKNIRLSPSVPIFNIANSTSTGANQNVTALKFVQQSSNIQPKLILGWGDDSAKGVDQYSITGTLTSVVRWMFNIGKRWEINYIRIPFGGAVAANTTITPKILIDDNSSSKSPTVINNANYPAKRKVIYKTPELKDYTGENNFMLEFTWSSTNPLSIALPIIINGLTYDDEPDK